jgi:hypothetical protein
MQNKYKKNRKTDEMNIRWQKMNKCNRFMNIRKNHHVDFAKKKPVLS